MYKIINKIGKDKNCDKTIHRGTFTKEDAQLQIREYFSDIDNNIKFTYDDDLHRFMEEHNHAPGIK